MSPTPAASSSNPTARAPLVWRRAVALVEPGQQHDELAVALELLRTARHHPGTVTQALAVGRLEVRRHPDEDAPRRAVQLLEQAVSVLGMRGEQLDGAVLPL